MSTNNTQLQERRNRLNEVAFQIDTIAKASLSIFENQTGDFAKELEVAQAVSDMRSLLSDEIMVPIMALMNTDLGFRTDRDPKKPDYNGKFPTPYPVDVVREVFIESKLRGFHTVGNEFNIIAGKFYACQAGFKRKVKELTKGTFESSIDIPVIASTTPDGGGTAKLKCRATWTLNSEKKDIGIRPEDPCELSIRVNKAMGIDAIVGKAERKLLKRVYERITGQIVPDGDADDSINVTATTQTDKEAPKLTFGKPDEKKPEPTATVMPEPPQPPPSGTRSTGGQETPQECIANKMVAAGVSFDDFRDWLKNTGRCRDVEQFGSYDELPTTLCQLIDDKALSKCIQIYGKKP